MVTFVVRLKAELSGDLSVGQALRVIRQKARDGILYEPQAVSAVSLSIV